MYLCICHAVKEGEIERHHLIDITVNVKTL